MALVAVLCIVAIAAAAATLTTTQNIGQGPGAGAGSGPGTGGDSTATENASAAGQSSAPVEPSIGLCFEVLKQPGVILLVLGISVVLFVLVARRVSRLVAIALALAYGPFVLTVYQVLTNCGTEMAQTSPTGSNASTPNASGTVTATPGGGGATPTTPPLVILAILGVLLVVALVAIARSSGDDVDLDERAYETEPEESPVEAIGRIAGETADRIDEAGDVDNEVYRAWREMVDQLHVDSPDSTTPGEFADAAVEAGMARPDVRELTDLFETVRYGGADPTADRERRAVEALRRIEREYAGADE